MLIEDTTAPRKHRHTAHRILARLIEEHGAGDAAGVPLFRVALLVRGQRLKGRCPVVQRCADGIMNGLKGGDVVMESREAEHAVLHAQDSAMSTGLTRLQPRSDFSSRIKFFRAKKRVRGAAVWGRSLVGEVGCGQCPHFGSRTGPYRRRTGPDSVCMGGTPVFARAGTRFESHLGHVFSLFRGLLASECAQTLHLWGPLRGLFLLVAVAVAGGLLSSLRAGGCPLVPVHGPCWLGQHDLNNPGSNAFMLDAGCSPASSSTAFGVSSAYSWWVRGTGDMTYGPPVGNRCRRTHSHAV